MSPRTLYRCCVLVRRSMKLILLVTFASFLAGSYLVIHHVNIETSGQQPEAFPNLHRDGAMPQRSDSDVGWPPPLEKSSHDSREEVDDHLSIKWRDNDPMGNPIVLWWTPFTGEIGSNRRCSTGTCFFTQDRLLKDSIERTPEKPVMYVFYGTDFHAYDLPLPRRDHEQWALLHEESPKNSFLFSHEDVMELFNYTSTFKTASDFPLTTQYIDSIETITSQEFFVPTKEKDNFRRERGFASVMYVQSSCEAPSDRDTYVAKLMEFIDIDSYGQCLHNKELPPHIAEPVEGMMHDDFLTLAGKYKFVLAMENALCDEYMTEKLWRPIRVGAVPIYFGSSKSSTSAWLPNGVDSAIFISDYPDPSRLAQELERLDADDEAYESFLQHKTTRLVKNIALKKALTDRKWGVSTDEVIGKGSFVSHFECFLCDKLHDMLRGGGGGGGHDRKITHYGCPEPVPIFHEKEANLEQTKDPAEQTNLKLWQDAYLIAKYEAKAMRELIKTQDQFSQEQLMELAMEIYSQSQGPG